MKKSNKGLLGIGLLSAIAASLCCITPILAFIVGASGMAATFSWLEPARPYLIGATILVLGFAWYQKLKQKKKIDCECEPARPSGGEDEKPSFWQSKKFLGFVTASALIMLAFPYYSGIFFPDKNNTQTIIINESDVVEARLTIEGMTCSGCEHHVNHSLTSNESVIEASSSYETGVAEVKFDRSKISVEELASAVEEETGYKVTQTQLIHDRNK